MTHLPGPNIAQIPPNQSSLAAKHSEAQQLIPQDTSPPLSKEDMKYIQ
jgi:hypothetical protein